ncbi:ABC transporter substrate-binding protein [Bosea sp. BK604]|uniref:ABC transporter substrate-binding protein n=1 Tax=Bosea sp. BK604 TaxID=2512180 RepID=UPI001A9E0298|nr:ABC transporter substrate-binding protein [Bosea sp. BK604]
MTLAGLASVPFIGAASAQSGRRLRIGVAAPATTLDPHLQNNGPNNALATHIFDSLVINNETSQSKPGLASSWRTLDDTHWEFTLRDGVKFSDGTAFGFEDVKVSIERATNLPSSSSFRAYTRNVKAVTPGGAPNTIVIETRTPDPLLLNSLSRVRIISARFKDAPSGDFDAGRAAIGTGPFLLKEYVPGSHTLLARNDAHWGAKPAWDEVILRIASNSGTRIAGLLAGEFDIVENVPAEMLDRIKADSKLHVITGVSSRVVFMGFDFGRDVTPFATDASGKPLARNPFKDPKVRQAFDYAINRQAIVDRVMEQQATVAAQYLPTGAPGTSDKLKPTPFDLAKAKALLAEAGYPQGFKLTIHGSNDRYINDSKIMQAIAQMLTRAGIETKVELLPWSVYFPKCNNNEFSFFLGSFGVNTGETSNPIVAINATFDAKTGMGPVNFGRYSNPALDAKLKQALPLLDDNARNGLLAQASEIVFDDRAILPLHFEGLILAAQKGIEYATRADQYTLAMGVTKA